MTIQQEHKDRQYYKTNKIMNKKRVAATVIALALTAGCAIAQKADKDGQRKTQMEQIEKNAVGMWQRVTKHKGNTY